MIAKLLLSLAILLMMYFSPTLIAVGRNAHRARGIAALNLLLGWTIIGWFAAFVWSLFATARQPLAIAPGKTGQTDRDGFAVPDFTGFPAHLSHR